MLFSLFNPAHKNTKNSRVSLKNALAAVACGLCVGCADTGHMLSHRADLIVFDRVVVEVVVVEWGWLVLRALLGFAPGLLRVCSGPGLDFYFKRL